MLIEIAGWPGEPSQGWQEQLPEPLCQSENLGNWLVSDGSLTTRLKQHCQNFGVSVLAQARYSAAHPKKSKLLMDGPYWQREVCLWGDGHPWILARSVWPDRETTECLSQLSTRPLGELLFKGGSAVLQHRQFGKFLSPDGQPLGARRNFYAFSATVIVVEELFLPVSPAYQRSKHDR